MTASLIHIVSEFCLLVSGGRHPLVVRGGDGGRVRGVQAGLQQEGSGLREEIATFRERGAKQQVCIRRNSLRGEVATLRERGAWVRVVQKKQVCNRKNSLRVEVATHRIRGALSGLYVETGLQQEGAV